MKKPSSVTLFALLFTLAVLAFGYPSFGISTTLIFTSGFLGGFILWQFAPMETAFAAIKTPYWITVAFFILHRIEENVTRFQQALSGITGTPVPEVTSLPILLLLITLVGAWLLGPYARSFFFAQKPHPPTPSPYYGEGESSEARRG